MPHPLRLPTAAPACGALVLIILASPAASAWQDPALEGIATETAEASEAAAEDADAQRERVRRAQDAVQRQERTVRVAKESRAGVEARVEQADDKLEDAQLKASSAEAALEGVLKARNAAEDAGTPNPALDEAVASARASLADAKARVEDAREALEAVRETRAAERERLAEAEAALEQGAAAANAEERRLAELEGAARTLATLGTAAEHAARGEWSEAADSLPDAAALETERVAARRLLACVAFAEQRDLDGAERACEAAAADHPSARRHLGLALLRAGRPDDGLRRLEGVRLAPDDAEAHRLAGLALAEAGRCQAALDHLEAVEAAGAADAEALHALGRCREELGRLPEAVEAYEAAYRLAPDRPGLAYRLARYYEERGERDRSQQLLRAWLGDERASAAWDRGLARCSHDGFHEAPFGFHASLPGAPDRAAGHVYLGVQAAEGGRVGEAAHQLDLALRLAPDDPRVRYNAGVLALGVGDYDRAREQLGAALEARPGWTAARVNLALAETRQGDHGRAVETLSPAAERSGADPRVHLTLGVALARAGEPEEARRRFTQVPSDSSRAAAAAHGLALLELEADQHDEAARRVEALDATFPELHFLRGTLAGASGDPARAAGHLREALAAEPSYLRARVELGRALLDDGRAEEAAAELRRAVALDPACAEAHAVLGAALGEAGDTDGESAEYRKARALREDRRRRAREAAGEGEAADARRVAVVEFDNTTGDPKLDWLRLGIPEALTTDLRKLSRLVVVERGQVAKLTREMKFASMDFVDPETAPELGKQLGADALVVGSFQSTGDRVRLLGRLVDLETREVLQEGEAEGAISEVFDLQRSLALSLVGDYARLTEEERERVAEAPKGSVSSLEKLALMRQKMLQGDEAAARAAYRDAVSRSPDWASDVEDLAEAYEDVSATLAVIPLRNLSGAAQHDWLGEGIATSLAGDMRRIGLPVVERFEVAKVIKEQKFGLVVEPDRASELGRHVGASVILIGGYQVLGDMLSIDARMVQVETGAVVLTERVTGPLDDLFELQTRLAEAMAESLELQVSPEELASLTEDKPDYEDFKDSVAKDRLFVVRQPSEGATAGADRKPWAIVAGVTSLVLAGSGAALYAAGSNARSDSDAALRAYQGTLDQDVMDEEYARAKDLDSRSGALRTGAWVAWGASAAALGWAAWEIFADHGPSQGQGSVDLARPRLNATPMPGGAAVQLHTRF
ncbi:MAG: FlgO family outer membrane protein [Myxococcota bacterium]